MASGTGRGRDAVEPRQDVRADMVRESDIQRVRQAILGVTVEHDATCEARARPARSLGNIERRESGAAMPRPTYFQRAFAALLAISLRRLADMPSARAFPPRRPSATAAGSFPSDSGVGISSSIWPVAIRMTWTALPITSAGRRSPLRPRGIIYRLALVGL